MKVDSDKRLSAKRVAVLPNSPESKTAKVAAFLSEVELLKRTINQKHSRIKREFAKQNQPGLLTTAQREGILVKVGRQIPFIKQPPNGIAMWRAGQVQFQFFPNGETKG